MENIILCSTHSDLMEIDKVNLKMNGITVVADLFMSLEPLVEGEASTLILTDKVIDEQSTLYKITNKIETIFQLYPKDIRIIYIKVSSEVDILVTTMDKYNNWDIHYNSDLKHIGTDGVLKLIEDKRIPTMNKTEYDLESVKAKAVLRANAFNEALSKKLLVTEESELQGILMANTDLVRDLVAIYNMNLKALTEQKLELRDKDTMLEQLSAQLQNYKAERITLTDTVNKLNEDRREMYSALLSVDKAHNSLVNSLKGLMNVEELNSSLSNITVVEDISSRAPLIIYFKEITPINYFTTFIKHLSSILTDTLGLSKVLVIENDYSTMKLPLYEEKDFVHLNEGTNMSAMVLGNILTFGNNKKLLNYLIHNSLNLDYLIVFDRTQLSNNLLVGANVINFYLSKNESDLQTLKVQSNNVISNTKDTNYTLSKVKEFAEVKGNQDLELQLLYSIPLTKQIIDYIVNWNKVQTQPLIEEDGELNKKLPVTIGGE